MIDPSRFAHLTANFQKAASRARAAVKDAEEAEAELLAARKAADEAKAVLYEYCDEAAFTDPPVFKFEGVAITEEQFVNGLHATRQPGNS